MSDQRLPVPGSGDGGYIWRLYSRLVDVFRSQRPAAGWKDLKGDISTGKTGANAPTWAQMADGLYAYRFDAGVTTQIWLNYHITHDVSFTLTREDGSVQGMTFYPHVHFYPTGTDTGTARFGIEWGYTRGYGIDALTGAEDTVYIEQAGGGTALLHQIVETDDDAALTHANFETDGIIQCRIFRDGGHANDTLTDDVFITYVDMHYYTDGMETNERNRDSTGIVPWTKKLMGL